MDTIDFVLSKLSLRRLEQPSFQTRDSSIWIWTLKTGLAFTSGCLLVAGVGCLLDSFHMFHDKKRNMARKLAQTKLKKLNASLKLSGGRQLKVDDLSNQELIIAGSLVTPEDIEIQWSDIAGLDNVVQELRETVVLPVQHRELFKHSQLWRPPIGVLLHGPPGCGKTLIAKAMAKEAGMRFINLDVATLTDKWYGETQKLAAAVFSLATKLEPAIIFIDEIDSLLRARGHTDHEATAMMKTQFMQLWDGLVTSGNAAVIVLGATNRPEDLDQAILRRMPAKFHIGMPNTGQRQQLLQLILKQEQLQPSVDLLQLATQTEGFSGYDLKELCRHACMHRMRQFMREALMTGSRQTIQLNAANEETFKDCLDVELHMEDLLESLSLMKKSRCTSSMKRNQVPLVAARR